MIKPQVNYDSLAATYNQRFAVGGRDRTADVLRELAQTLAARQALEVGCGTGHWLAQLCPHVAAVFGLDLSQGMLAQAQHRALSLRLIRGQGCRLPFADASCDLVYCINAIHHFPDPRAFIHEARRLTRPGGMVAVIGSDPQEPAHRWYAYDYFPEIRTLDLARFPAWSAVTAWMVEAGLTEIARRNVECFSTQFAGRAVLADPFLRKHNSSQLALLSAEAYAAGIDRLEADLCRAETAGVNLSFHSDIVLDMLCGRVPRA